MMTAFPSSETVALFRSALQAIALDASSTSPHSPEHEGERAARAWRAEQTDDPGAPASTVSDRTVARIAASAEIRAALRALSSEAHAQAMRAEHLLVIFKEIWQALPEVRALPVSVSRGQLLSRVIGVCLDEYYGISD